MHSLTAGGLSTIRAISICRHLPRIFMGGSRYFVLFVDDLSRFTRLYLFQNLAINVPVPNFQKQANSF